MASESPTVGDVSSSASVAPSEEEREQALLMMANELKPYLESDKVPGDGNCLYHSIACQTLGGGEHAVVRASVVEEVEGNPHRYIGFAPDLHSWVADQKEEGAWGDGVAVKACSWVYQSPVLVWRKRAPTQPPSVFLPPTIEGDKSPPICLELDEERGAEHYSPLMISPVKVNPKAVNDLREPVF